MNIDLNFNSFKMKFLFILFSLPLINVEIDICEVGTLRFWCQGRLQ